jgi:hypothetical protein
LTRTLIYPDEELLGTQKNAIHLLSKGFPVTEFQGVGRNRNLCFPDVDRTNRYRTGGVSTDISFDGENYLWWLWTGVKMAEGDDARRMSGLNCLEGTIPASLSQGFEWKLGRAMVSVANLL